MPLRGYIKYLTEKIYNDYNNMVLFLPAVMDWCKAFQNITLMWNGLNKNQKNIAGEETANIKIFAG